MYSEVGEVQSSPSKHETGGAQLFETMVELLRARTSSSIEAGFTFLQDDKVVSWSFAELDRRARAVGACLQERRAEGRTVLLLFPPGLDYIAAFFGCLYAGAIPVPAYPPDRARLTRVSPRLESIADDAGAKLVLSTRDLADAIGALGDRGTALARLDWLAADDLPRGAENAWQPPKVYPGSIAFIQYTSGSTASPKGVIVTHANLLHNLHQVHRKVEHSSKDRVVSWLPMHHDMGLIGGVLEPLYGNSPVTLMSPMAFLQRPLRWLRVISERGATISAVPNFAYDWCLRKISPEERDSLDLRHWRVALTGAEPVRARTLDAFAEFFGPCGFRRDIFYPCYGLAEGTLMVSGGRPGREPMVRVFSASELEQGRVRPARDSERGVELVGCGTALDRLTIAIVDPQTSTPCGPDRVGEIWTHGPSVARGYWRRKDATRDTFHAQLDGGATAYLRTGDLGFVHDGQLFIAGRRKDLLIVRGRNLHPHDIELAAERAHPALRPGAVIAFGIECNGQEEVVIGCEVDPRSGADHDEVLAAVRKRIAETQELVPHAVLVLRRGTIPKTTSGKVQRQACAGEFSALRLEIMRASIADVNLEGSRTAPPSSRGPVDADAMRRAAVARLGIRSDFAPQARLSDAGIGYAALLETVRALEESLGVTIAVDALLVRPTLETLVSLATAQPAVAPAAARSVAEIERWFVAQIGRQLGLAESQIEVDQPFVSIGLDSMAAVTLAEQLSQWLGSRVSPTLAWDYPTIQLAARALGRAESSAPADAGVRAPAIDTRAPRTHAETGAIAIVGIGCRFPGASGPDDYWRLLKDGRDAISEVPSTRWDSEDAHGAPADSAMRWGGFLDQIDQFDAQFFGISAREAVRVDPQQRLLLEVTWEALEHAGYPRERLAGSPTGVFVGISSSDYYALQAERPETLDAYAGTGNAHSIAANRISYFLDLKGPSMAVDTACSASLVAVHLACESLRRGECSLALAGGVNLMMTSHIAVTFSQAQMLSPDGRCKSFDESANGYVRSEGCGVVVLKRLSDVADHERVIAVIRGGAVGHDGRSNGLTAPNSAAQRDVMRRGLAAAAVEAASVEYVEAHGTGTRLGDPMELASIAAIYGDGRAPHERCRVGSVKTNIGHLEAAAGIAGLVKAALMVERGELVPHLHFKRPTSHVDWTSSGLEVPTRRMPWRSRRRLAAVSSFGFGGTNAHLIIEQPPDRVGKPDRGERPAHVVCLSAKTPAALDKVKHQLRTYLASDREATLADVAYTANAGRTHFAERVAMVVDSVASLEAKLREPGSRADTTRAIRKAPRIAFLFSGQGAQYVGMGRHLYATQPTFRAAIDECDRLAQVPLGRSLCDFIVGNADEGVLEDTRYAQPALFALEYALTRLWQSWGVTPDVVLGHSIGEYAAAAAAGVFSLRDALLLVVERGRIMSAQPPGGGMLACLGRKDVVLGVLGRYAQHLAVAADNAPQSVVISGEQRALDAFKQEVEREGVTTQALRVSHAFHSAMMEGALAPFEAIARSVPCAAPTIPLISNLTGRPFADGEAPSPAYWRRQLRDAVQFATGAQSAHALGCDVFIEIGPGSSLLTLGRHATSTPPDVLWLPSLRRGIDDWGTLLDSLARLYERGAAIDWDGFDRDYSRRTTNLPVYPFERTRYWLEESTARRPHAGSNGKNGHHAPIGTEIYPAGPNGSNGLNGSNGSNGSNGASGSVLHVRDASVPDTTSAMIELLREQSIALRRISESLGSTAPVNGHVAPSPDESNVVLQEISRICGFPVERIALDLRLGSDLGFDSLLAMELHRKLAAIYPALAGAERNLLAQDVTVADVLRLIQQHVAGGTTPIAGAAPLVSPSRESSRVTVSVAAPSAEPAAVPAVKHTPEDANIERWPELHALEERALDLAVRGQDNPYTRTRTGFNSARAESSGRPILNFAAFNYLGLSNHPQVRDEAKRAIDQYGTGCSATPLLFGETPLHHDLEATIASFLGTDDAIVFPGGHATNVAVVGHLYGPHDLIVHDELIHDSTIRGCILSGAARRMFRHNDWQDLERILAATRAGFRRVLIVLEGTYSQDGDIPSLPHFIDVKKKYAAQLMIDEAHSIGVVGPTGRGIGEHFGVQRDDVDLWMGTLSKALGSCGGYIAAKAAIVRYLRFTTPLFIFATGITPGDAAAARASLRVLQAEPERVSRLQRLVRMFVAGARERGLDTGVAGPSAIVPIILGDWHRTIAASNALHERGINAMPIGHPAVAKDACRLRFFINVEHTEDQLRMALDAVAELAGSRAPTSSLDVSAGQPGNGTATQRGSGRMIQNATKSSQPEVLVAGATGFIGSRLTERLVDAGTRVRVLVRPGSNRQRLESLGVELVEGTLEDTASLRRATHGIRVIYNCTGLSTDWARWSDFDRTNVAGVKNLLEAAVSAGTTQRFLHLSTTDVYGYPVQACDESTAPRDVGLPYNRSKLLGEQAVLECHKTTGLPVTIVRPVTVYGPRSKDWVIEIGKLLR